MEGIDKVYVLHCKRGYEDREVSINAQFAKQAIPFEYVQDWDISDMDDAVIERYFRRRLSAVSMSACLKHFRAAEKVVENGYGRSLIFEDDVVLSRDFKAILARVVEESKKMAEDHAIFLSNSGNYYTPRSRRRPGQYLYEAAHSRAADAYLVSGEVCRKRVEWLRENGFTLPIDHQFHVVDQALGIRTFWVEDPIAEQGSMNGLFKSAVEVKHAPVVQRLRWQLDKFYKKHILRNLR